MAACVIQGYVTKYGPMSGVKLWMSDVFQEPAHASVANLIYKAWPQWETAAMAPTLALAPLTQMLVRNSLMVKRGTLVSNNVMTSEDFELTLDITPRGLVEETSSIMLLT